MIVRTIARRTRRAISSSPLKNSRLLHMIRDSINRVNLHRDVAMSKLRVIDLEVDVREGWGGEDISAWPVYGFFSEYLGGRHETARTSFNDWYLDMLKKYHTTPRSKGGMNDGTLYRYIAAKYAEKGIDFQDNIFLDFDIVYRSIREKVDSRFELLETIRRNGYDNEVAGPFEGIRKRGLIYLINGHHRWAILKLLGYTTVPEVRLIGVFDNSYYYEDRS